MKVLIIKISSMGDIIHTFPAVNDAYNCIPNISFHWVVEDVFSELPMWHPAVEQIIPIKLRYWKKKWYKIFSWREYYKCIKQLNYTRYDVIIDAQGLLKTSIFITNNIRGEKHGMNYKSAREPISCWCYNRRHYINKNQHAIERIRQLFSSSLQYPVLLNIGQYNIKKDFMKNFQKSNIFPYLIFLHSTTRLIKHWPEHYWNRLIQYAIDSGYCIKLPFWTEDERMRVERLMQRYRCVVALPRLTLQQIAGQLLQATAIISVDTGLSHLAAALGCPNLTLYGPTDPKLIGVYGSNQAILRSPTKKMEHLTAVYVWETFHKIFGAL